MLRTHTSISLKEHPELVGLLHDQAFRQCLESEPAKALSRFGFQLRAEDTPDSVTLPSAPSRATLVWLGLF